MKRLLIFLSAILTVLCAQAQNGQSVVNNLQVNTAKGTAPYQVMPVNGGLGYFDVNGFLKKATFQSLLGAKIDSITKVNDTLFTVKSQWGNTYNISLRGAYSQAEQNYLDSQRSGLYPDTNIIQNMGVAGVRIASSSPTLDTLQIAKLLASPEIGFKKNSDSTISAYVIKKTQNAKSGNYTLVSSDTTSFITENAATADTITVPTDATTISPGISIDFYQLGSGKLCVVAATGVALSARGGRLKALGQYSKLALSKIASNTWILSGDLDTVTIAYFTTSLQSMSGFSTTAGTPSSSGNFTTSGFNLTAGATVTAPTGYEVSLDNTTFASTRSISLSGSSLASQPVTVYARLTAAASVGTYIGNITITSTSTTTSYVTVSGVVH